MGEQYSEIIGRLSMVSDQLHEVKEMMPGDGGHQMKTLMADIRKIKQDIESIKQDINRVKHTGRWL